MRTHLILIPPEYPLGGIGMTCSPRRQHRYRRLQQNGWRRQHVLAEMLVVHRAIEVDYFFSSPVSSQSTDLPKVRLMASRARNGEGKWKLCQLRPINKDKPSECAPLTHVT